MINAQSIRRLALVGPPIRGVFLLGVGSYFSSSMVRPFFLAMIWNSAPNVSVAFSVKFGTTSFLTALKLEKVSVMPNNSPSVLKAIVF